MYSWFIISLCSLFGVNLYFYKIDAKFFSAKVVIFINQQEHYKTVWRALVVPEAMVGKN